jgi:integrase/recombinase XerC
VGAGRIGRVEQDNVCRRWRVVFPDSDHEAAASFLRELVASDCSPATARSYAYALLRWLRFLLDRHVEWDRADQTDVRAFVEHLREVPNPQRLRRRADGPVPGSVNPRTGKPAAGRHYGGPDDQSSAQRVVRLLRARVRRRLGPAPLPSILR